MSDPIPSPYPVTITISDIVYRTPPNGFADATFAVSDPYVSVAADGAIEIPAQLQNTPVDMSFTMPEGYTIVDTRCWVSMANNEVTSGAPNELIDSDASAAPICGFSYEYLVFFTDLNGQFGVIDPRITNDF